MARQSKKIAIVFALSLFAILAFAVLLKPLEIFYRLHRLRHLREWPEWERVGEFMMDNSVDEQERHVERLVELGVYFKKTYDLSSTQLTGRELYQLLIQRFPESNYWSFSMNKELEIRDWVNQEPAWQHFIEVELKDVESDPSQQPE